MPGDWGSPAVAMNDDGMVIMAGPYADPNSGLHGVWVRHQDAGGGWTEPLSPPVPVHTQAVTAVQVGIDAEGNGVVAYLAPPDGAIAFWHVEYTTYERTSGAWNTPIPLPSDVDILSPRIAINPAGDALVAATEDAADGGVRVYWLGEGEVRIAPQAGLRASQLDAQMAAEGEGFLIWREADATPTLSRIRAARTTSTGAVQLDTLDDNTARVPSFPALSARTRSRATASWSSREAFNSHQLQVATYTELGGWAAPQTALTSTTALSGTRVTTSPAGQVTVLGFSSKVGEVVTELSPSSFSDPRDATTIEGAISLQFVDDAQPLYLDDGRLVVGFLTNIGGIADIGITLCE